VRLTVRLKNLAYVFLLCTVSASSIAYTISPKDDIHEAFTRAAKTCFDEAVLKGEKPTECAGSVADADDVDTAWIRNSTLAWYDVIGRLRRLSGADARFPTLEEAVRWPDDPTRQIGVLGVVKFGVNMLSDCDKYIHDNPLGINDINDGLLCSSHFGVMQFFHSQASQVGEPYETTILKIKAWAALLFNIGAGRLSDAELDTEYCSFFSGEDALSKAMLPNQQAVPCEKKKDPKWRLTTLFTFKCPNPLSSVGCYEETGQSRFDKTRIYAAGALLHLVQDSFSQSHVERGECEVRGDKVKAKIECLPASGFTTYRGQIKHDEADRRPTFANSCSEENGMDDPITASAKVLWHLHSTKDLKEFQKDFDAIFGNESPERPATLGICFTTPQ